MNPLFITLVGLYLNYCLKKIAVNPAITTAVFVTQRVIIHFARLSCEVLTSSLKFEISPFSSVLRFEISSFNSVLRFEISPFNSDLTEVISSLSSILTVVISSFSSTFVSRSLFSNLSSDFSMVVRIFSARAEWKSWASSW